MHGQLIFRAVHIHHDAREDRSQERRTRRDRTLKQMVDINILIPTQLMRREFRAGQQVCGIGRARMRRRKDDTAPPTARVGAVHNMPGRISVEILCGFLWAFESHNHNIYKLKTIAASLDNFKSCRLAKCMTGAGLA